MSMQQRPFEKSHSLNVQNTSEPHQYAKQTSIDVNPQTPYQQPVSAPQSGPFVPQQVPFQQPTSGPFTQGPQAPQQAPFQQAPPPVAPYPQQAAYNQSWNQPPAQAWGVNSQSAQPPQQWGGASTTPYQQAPGYNAYPPQQTNAWGQQAPAPQAQWGTGSYSQGYQPQQNTNWGAPPTQYGMGLNIPVDYTQPMSVQIIAKIKLAITKYNINIVELFKKYDKSQNFTLEVHEFGEMIKKIDQTIADQDIQQTFRVFDDKNMGSITFEQFRVVLADQNQNQPQQPQYGAWNQPGYQPQPQYPPYQQPYQQNNNRPYPPQ